MNHPDGPSREPLGTVLARLCDLIQAQTDALSADDFDSLDRHAAEREQLGAALGDYTAADACPEDRALLDRVAALDQRLLTLARESLSQTSQGLRDVHRGRGALAGYQKREQMLLRNRAHLDLEG